MGASLSQCNGVNPFPKQYVRKLIDTDLDQIRSISKKRGDYMSGCLSSISIYHKDDPDRIAVKEMFKNDFKLDDITADRAFGSFMGMPIGDALGAPFEFSKVHYGRKEMENGFSEKAIWKKQNYNRFDLKPGQWTDDASMGLALADSLIVNQGLAPIDLRHRFILWWSMGYCNAFGYDNERKYKSSVGLGGNISESMSEFAEKESEYTNAGDKNTSGNGSVMRNAPIPIFFLDDPTKALEAARNQSRTTHQGTEAAECCRLLTHIVIKAIKGDGTTKILEDLGSSFSSNEKSVQCLAESKPEDTSDVDRNWNWKSPEFKYSPTRANSQPGYIGSYAMDAMAMALHCVWTTNNFKDALLKCANIRGDSDSVSSVAGQIAGAIYGLSSIPQDWIVTVLKWDPDWDILLRAYKLFYKKTIYKWEEKMITEGGTEKEVGTHQRTEEGVGKTEEGVGKTEEAAKPVFEVKEGTTPIDVEKN